MAPSNINILISTFAGLELPPTLSLHAPPSTSFSDLNQQLATRLPVLDTRWVLSTLSGAQLDHHSTVCLSTLLSRPEDDFISLRLSVPVLGGKGGFGSQLRAAGGRMSSKRKKNEGDTNGSSRNLDGRRLRTVTEAKALAEYLSIKPEMERREKEKRRQRWEQVVEMTEQREQRIRKGLDATLDGKWVEAKEEAGERTRDAVVAAMKSGGYRDNLVEASHGPPAGESSEESSEKDTPSNEADAKPPVIKSAGKAKTFVGFEEEEDSASSDEDEDEDGKKSH